MAGAITGPRKTRQIGLLRMLDERGDRVFENALFAEAVPYITMGQFTLGRCIQDLPATPDEQRRMGLIDGR